MTGIFGKLPAHGDFVQRGLPLSFVTPWDQWLQVCVDSARGTLADDFDVVWQAAPAWRFRLPSGVCGDGAVAGVLLPSRDRVGRPFPITLAAVFSSSDGPPASAWYARLESVARDALARADQVDVVHAALPEPVADDLAEAEGDAPPDGWWRTMGQHWSLTALPTTSQFLSLLQSEARPAKLQSSAASHRGTVRQRNEDAFLDRGDIGVWAVADGAGGHGAGDVASAAIVAALADLPTTLSAAELLAQVRLRTAAVHRSLQQQTAALGKDGPIATTLVVLMARNHHFACLWAGDSRAYLLRDGELVRMTHDHSVVQELIDAGELAAAEAEVHPQANIITRAVGADEALELAKVSGDLRQGDVILLCTDGLFKAIPEADISRLLGEGACPDELIHRALQAGARDNLTALTIRA